MKIALLADTHFGWKQFSKITTRNVNGKNIVLNKRENDNYNALLWSCKIIRESADICLLAGDLIHKTGNMNAYIYNMMFKFFNELKIPTIVIAGNHDEERGTIPLDFLNTIPNVTYVPKDDIIEINDDINIYCEGHQPIPSQDDVYDHSNLLSSYRDMENKAKEDKDKINILLGHGILIDSLKEYHQSPSSYNGSRLYPNSSLENYDYVVLGHNHTHYVIDNYISPGTLFNHSIAEGLDQCKRGVTIIDTDIYKQTKSVSRSLSFIEYTKARSQVFKIYKNTKEDKQAFYDFIDSYKDGIAQVYIDWDPSEIPQSNIISFSRRNVYTSIAKIDEQFIEKHNLSLDDFSGGDLIKFKESIDNTNIVGSLRAYLVKQNYDQPLIDDIINDYNNAES